VEVPPPPPKNLQQGLHQPRSPVSPRSPAPMDPSTTMARSFPSSSGSYKILGTSSDVPPPPTARDLSFESAGAVGLPAVSPALAPESANRPEWRVSTIALHAQMQARVLKVSTEPPAFLVAHSALGAQPTLESSHADDESYEAVRLAFTPDARRQKARMHVTDDEADLDPDQRPTRTPAESSPSMLPASMFQTPPQLSQAHVRERLERARAKTERPNGNGTLALVEQQQAYKTRISLLEGQVEKYRVDNNLLRSDLERMQATLAVANGPAPAKPTLMSYRPGASTCGMVEKARRASSLPVHRVQAARVATRGLPKAETQLAWLASACQTVARILWLRARSKVLAVVRLCRGMPARRNLPPSSMSKAIALAKTMVLRPRMLAPPSNRVGIALTGHRLTPAAYEQQEPAGGDRAEVDPSVQRGALQWLHGELSPGAETRNWLKEQAEAESRAPEVEEDENGQPSRSTNSHSAVTDEGLQRGRGSSPAPSEERASPLMFVTPGRCLEPRQAPQTRASGSASVREGLQRARGFSPVPSEGRTSPLMLITPGRCLEPRQAPRTRTSEDSSGGTWLSLLLGHLGQVRSPFSQARTSLSHSPLTLDGLQRLDVADPPARPHDTGMTGGSKGEETAESALPTRVASQSPPVGGDGVWTSWMHAFIGTRGKPAPSKTPPELPEAKYGQHDEDVSHGNVDQ